MVGGLFGAVDIFFAPVATRFRTYGVDVPAVAQTYFNALLTHPLVEAWCALGEEEDDIIPLFELPASGR